MNLSTIFMSNALKGIIDLYLKIMSAENGIYLPKRKIAIFSVPGFILGTYFLLKGMMGIASLIYFLNIVLSVMGGICYCMSAIHLQSWALRKYISMNIIEDVTGKYTQDEIGYHGMFKVGVYYISVFYSRNYTFIKYSHNKMSPIIVGGKDSSYVMEHEEEILKLLDPLQIYKQEV